MKKYLTLCLCLAALLCAIFITTPEANAATYGNLTYTVSNGEATITDCNTSATGELVIPPTIDCYPVTIIGDYAFFGCRKLTDSTIPDSVITIGSRAFDYCTKLTSVTIPDSVTTIGEGAFSSCSNLTSVTIPDSVTTIGFGAFNDCTRLTEIRVSINNPNYSSDRYGFLFNKDMTELITAPGAIQSYTIPDSVTSIGDDAFLYCTSLTSVTIPDSVTTIGNYAFYYCTKLTSVTIPDSVTTIGYCAFHGCTSLSSVTIPNRVVTI